MNEFNQMIDDIIALLNTDSPQEELATDLAERYQEACRSANLRLQECEELLRKGHRTEAIQRANTAPDLLELVGCLAFPELQYWLEFLQRVGFPAAPPLKTDLARELNRQMAAEQPLEKLLRKHRLLALGRAPLVARISVLRMIRDKDPNNPAWHTDILELEKARSRELSAEIDQVATAANLIAANQLTTELESGDWSIAIPDEHLNRLQVLRADLVRDDLRRQLDEISQGLSQAWNEFDFELGRSERERWYNLYQVGDLPADSPILEVAEDALRWIEEEDNRVAEEEASESATLSLEQTVADSDTDRDRLHAAYRQASNFGQPLSEVLLARYRERIAVFDLADRRKQRFRYVIIGVILLVVGGFSASIIRMQRNRSVLLATTVEAKAMFDSGEYTTLVEWHDKLLQTSPVMAESGDVQHWVSKSKKAIHQYENDFRKFHGQMKLARGNGEPSQFDAAALESAEALAKKLSADERILVTELQSELSEFLASRGKVRTAEFKSELSDLAEQVDELGKRPAATVAEVVAVQGELVNLKERFFDLPPSTTKVADIMMARLEELKKNVTRTEFISMWHERTKSTIGDADEFQSQLMSFLSKYPDDVMARDLKIIVDEQLLWKGLVAWSEFYAKPEFDRFDALDFQRASGLKRAGNLLLVQFSASPLAARFREHLQHIEAVQDRKMVSQAKLQRFVEHPINIAFKYMVQGKDGSRYYTRQNVSLLGEVVEFDAVTGSSGIVEEQTIPKSTISYCGPNPLVPLAEKIRSSLDALKNGANWDSEHLKMFQAALEDEPQLTNKVTNSKEWDGEHPLVDSLWRLRVLDYVVQSGNDGKGLFGLLLERMQVDPERIGNVVDLGVDWIEPGNSDAESERSLANDLIITPWKENYDEEKQGLSQLRSRFYSVADCRYTWIGFATRVGSGLDQSWQIVLSANAPGELTGSLHVIVQQSMGKSAILEIGKVLDGMIELNDGARTGQLVVGRPVFIQLLPQDGADGALK